MSQRIYNDIKEIVLDIIGAYNPADVLMGTVISLSPFVVEVDGNSEYYPESCFIIPEYLTERKEDVSFTGTYNEGDLNFEGELTIKSSLKEGDVVILLKCQQGQKLLVLDKTGG